MLVGLALSNLYNQLGNGKSGQTERKSKKTPKINPPYSDTDGSFQRLLSVLKLYKPGVLYAHLEEALSAQPASEDLLQMPKAAGEKTVDKALSRQNQGQNPSQVGTAQGRLPLCSILPPCPSSAPSPDFLLGECSLLHQAAAVLTNGRIF